jgi:hypothetical protein
MQAFVKKDSASMSGFAREFPECRLAFKSKTHMHFPKLEKLEPFQLLLQFLEVFHLSKVHLSEVLTPKGAREAYSGLEVEK